MHPAQELILKKRDGDALSRDEIASFVAGICDRSVTDAQIAAFAMATWFRGMTAGEQMALTLAMRDSGRVLDWSGLGGPTVDKHSTGGVGDMVSLILAPIMAACGCYVPMISGRGLGHTGGTLDKLESIPGLQTDLASDRFQRLVREHGLAIVGQTEELVPADRRLYAVRDETATVASVPLIVSSILSKKLAEGLDALVLDIKCGSGGFMEGVEDALSLARELSGVACAVGLPCNALITGMDQPLAWSAGNALEVREAIDFLKGDARHERLHAVVLGLSAELLQLAGCAASPEEAADLARAALDSGHAAERFAAMACAQGGPSRLLSDPGSYLPSAAHIAPVFSDRAGFITRIDTRAIGLAVVQMGGGRRRAADAVDPSVGLDCLARPGQETRPGSPLAVVHAADDGAWQRAAATVRSAVTIGPEPPASAAAVLTRVIGGEENDS
jgi:thymidine phosphorylase